MAKPFNYMMEKCYLCQYNIDKDNESISPCKCNVKVHTICIEKQLKHGDIQCGICRSDFNIKIKMSLKIALILKSIKCMLFLAPIIKNIIIWVKNTTPLVYPLFYGFNILNYILYMNSSTFSNKNNFFNSNSLFYGSVLVLIFVLTLTVYSYFHNSNKYKIMFSIYICIIITRIIIHNTLFTYIYITQLLLIVNTLIYIVEIIFSVVIVVLTIDGKFSSLFYTILIGEYYVINMYIIGIRK